MRKRRRRLIVLNMLFILNLLNKNSVICQLFTFSFLKFVLKFYDKNLVRPDYAPVRLSVAFLLKLIFLV